MKALTVLGVVAAAFVSLVTADPEAEPSPGLGLGLGGGYRISHSYGYGLGHGLGYGHHYGHGLGYGLGSGLGYKLGYGPYSFIGGHYRRRREAEPKAEADPGLVAGHKRVHHESYSVIVPPFGIGYGIPYGYGYGYGLPFHYGGGYLG